MSKTLSGCDLVELVDELQKRSGHVIVISDTVCFFRGWNLSSIDELVVQAKRMIAWVEYSNNRIRKRSAEVGLSEENPDLIAPPVAGQ